MLSLYFLSRERIRMSCKKYEELTLIDDFVFCKVFSRNKELCKELLEIILNIKISDIVFPEPQKTIDITTDGKGIRLDVYTEDTDNTVYDVEMQTTDTKNIPKRSRYYQGMIDLNTIQKGENYNRLKKTFVIFFCTFDLFGEGRSIYTFENRCNEDPSIVLGDDSIKVFINIMSDGKDVPKKVQEFLCYLKDQSVSGNFVKQVDKEVKKVLAHKEWRNEFMTLLMREQEKFDEGFEKGKEKGKIIQLKELVESGMITTENAAKAAGMSVKEFTSWTDK